MSETIDDLVGYSFPLSSAEEAVQTNEKNSGAVGSNEPEREMENAEPFKAQQDLLMEMANANIETLFRDQYGEGFAEIFVKGHHEVISLSSSRFKRFLSKTFYETTERIPNTESVNNVVNLLQAKAEFGDIQYGLNLRVAEYDGDMYYDLTNERHQCIKISKNGSWEVLDQTPVPLVQKI